MVVDGRVVRLIDRVPALRWVSALSIVAMAAAAVVVVARSRHRLELGCVLAIGALVK